MKAKGIVEKPDVIGAIFGQTEGLLGQELDLRELQATGRIGRIEVNIKNVSGKSEGEVTIPSSLDASETSLIAACLETIERVGPCDAGIELLKIEDVRAVKREYIIDRAKDILKNQIAKAMPTLSEVTEQIKEAVKVDEITTYQGLPCGPDFEDSTDIIIVEGRADVINLLRNGVANTLAIEGTSVPDQVAEIIKERTTTVFVDGDRGGELIVKEIMHKAEIDFVAVAPDGKEVEELTKKEIFKALRSRITAEQFTKGHKMDSYVSPKSGIEEREAFRQVPSRKQKARPVRIDAETKERFRGILEEIVGSRAALIYDSKNDLLGKVPLSELLNTLRTVNQPASIVIDGLVDQQLAIAAKNKGVKYLVGTEKDSDARAGSVIVLDKKDLE